MWNPARTTAFAAVFRNEVLLNSKRAAPYLMIALFAGNALLWWGWGPAESRGLAVNSEHLIAGMMPVFSFMTLPFFTAVIMGDPVVRDFRAGVTPLIFSKPVGRASYLLGKFFGNFFVLVCCQAAFPLTFFALQWFRRPNMIVQPVKALPYLEHFLLLVVVSHLTLAALHFTTGTLTRSPKVVYALAVLLYPLYLVSQASLLKGLPPGWRTALDPLLMNFRQEIDRAAGRTPAGGEVLNQLAVSYGPEAIANRVAMILVAAACLAILYVRFARAERAGGGERAGHLSLINLSTDSDRIYNDTGHLPSSRADQSGPVVAQVKAAIPKVNIAGRGFRAGLAKLLAALGVEFRLLRAERGLVVFVPLAVFLSTLEPAFYGVTPGVPYSAAYAGDSANALLLFLLGLIVFYTGEAMHRDRELRVEPVLWSTPAPNAALLLSKFCATLLLALALVALVALVSAGLQVYKGHTPVELSAYLGMTLLILAPTAILAAAASVALNVLLRDKYVAYAAQIAAAVGLFYLYGQGHNHPLYNPALYRLWTHADLTGTAGWSRLLPHRLYCLALACACLSLAHLCFGRRSSKMRAAGGRLTGAVWPLMLTALSLAGAVAAGFLVASSTR